jgi:hypothetical protein
MKFYTSLGEIPELSHLTPEQRQQAWKVCSRKYALGHWQTWASIILIALLTVLGGRVAGPLGGAIGAALGGLGLYVTMTNVLRPHFRQYTTQQLPPEDPIRQLPDGE